MKNEENVCGETTLTEDAKTMKMDSGEQTADQNASTVLGKFKNVDALAQAYSALQAEFTRRSQRLKALERETENLKAGHGADALGVEKLRKNAKVKREESKRFDKFLADVVAGKTAFKPVASGEEEPSAILNSAEETATEKDVVLLDMPENEQPQDAVTADSVVSERAPMMEEGEVHDDAKVNGGKQASAVQASEKGTVAKEAVLSSEGLYERVQKDEQVRLRIIGEYLDSIGKSGAPVTCGNHGILAAPPLRAKTIADAGGMALHYFKNQANYGK